jgi:hypothetical protein
LFDGEEGGIRDRLRRLNTSVRFFPTQNRYKFPAKYNRIKTGNEKTLYSPNTFFADLLRYCINTSVVTKAH